MHVKYILPCSLITIYGLESMMVFHHDIILNTVKIIEGETTSSNVNLDDLMTGDQHSLNVQGRDLVAAALDDVSTGASQDSEVAILNLKMNGLID